MGLVSLPNLLVNGTPQDGSEVYANDKALRDVINGQIDVSNVANTAGLLGTMLTATPGSRIIANRLETDSVDSRVLKKDATTGSPGAAIQDGTYIKDGAVNGLKLSSGTVGSVALALGSVTYSPTGSITPAHVGVYDTGLLSTAVVPLEITCNHSGVMADLAASPESDIRAYVYLNTTNNHYYIVVYNSSQITTRNLGTDGRTYTLYYLTKAST